MFLLTTIAKCNTKQYRKTDALVSIFVSIINNKNGLLASINSEFHEIT